MALSLLKLVASGETAASPTAVNYFHSPATAYTSTSIYCFTPANCTTNTGGTPAAFTTATTSNGYYLLFVNGVLQEANLYTVGSTKVIIQVSATSTVRFNIRQSAPITLTVTNFDPKTTFIG